MGLVMKNTPAHAGDPGSISGLGRSPGGGNGNPLQYSCLENPMDRVLVGYSPWGCKESDTTKVTQHAHTQAHTTPTTGYRIVCEGWRWGGGVDRYLQFLEKKVHCFHQSFTELHDSKRETTLKIFPEFLPRGLMDSTQLCPLRYSSSPVVIKRGIRDWKRDRNISYLNREGHLMIGTKCKVVN